MSYCSENKLPLATSISRLFEVVDLLGYEKTKDRYKIEGQLASYVWIASENVISFVGIEMEIYRQDDCISVQIRTRAGRSYWDLEHQNKTISLLKSLFGGTFTTDEGTNRYMKFDVPVPSRISCSLFVCRWIYNNAVSKVKIYLQSRNMTGDIARKEPTMLPWLDSLNPRILSDNMIIPYLIGCWESYFRNCYINILRYSDNIPENALRKCKPSPEDLLQAVKKETPLECLLADSLSFQRPNIITENFRQLNQEVNIAEWLKRPYHRRRKTLYDSLTDIISLRDSIVHTGDIDLHIMDKEILQIMDDLTVAVDRVYQGFGQVFDFKPDYSF